MQINPSTTWSSWRSGWKHRHDQSDEQHSSPCAQRAEPTAIEDLADRACPGKGRCVIAGVAGAGSCSTSVVAHADQMASNARWSSGSSQQAAMCWSLTSYKPTVDRDVRSR